MAISFSPTSLFLSPSSIATSSSKSSSKSSLVSWGRFLESFPSASRRRHRPRPRRWTPTDPTGASDEQQHWSSSSSSSSSRLSFSSTLLAWRKCVRAARRSSPSLSFLVFPFFFIFFSFFFFPPFQFRVYIFLNRVYKTVKEKGRRGHFYKGWYSGDDDEEEGFCQSE